MASLTNQNVPTEKTTLDKKYSGLMNYLFGKDRKKEINKEQFLKLQQDLINDIFWLGFTGYGIDGNMVNDLPLNFRLCSFYTTQNFFFMEPKKEKNEKKEKKKDKDKKSKKDKKDKNEKKGEKKQKEKKKDKDKKDKKDKKENKEEED